MWDFTQIICSGNLRVLGKRHAVEGEANTGQLDPWAGCHPWTWSRLPRPCSHLQWLHQGPRWGWLFILSNWPDDKIIRIRFALVSWSTWLTSSAYSVLRLGQNICQGRVTWWPSPYQSLRLEEFLKMDNDRNWRFRLELCNQVKSEKQRLI